MRSTFNILFYVNKSKEKNGVVPVMERVTINGTQSQFSCKKSIPLDMWDVKGNCVIRLSALLFMLRICGGFLFFPLVNVPDDSMIPRPFPNHSHDTAPYHLIGYKVALRHCDIPIASVCLLSESQQPLYQSGNAHHQAKDGNCL